MGESRAEADADVPGGAARYRSAGSWFVPASERPCQGAISTTLRRGDVLALLQSPRLAEGHGKGRDEQVRRAHPGMA
jgi:hypothetical protein